MSKNYDNWERLVAAVIKREEVWELCHDHSSSTSFSSSVSSDFNSQFHEDFKSARSAFQELSSIPQIDVERIEQPEPRLLTTLGYSKDETTEIRRIQLRRSIFREKAAAETWWSNNRDKVNQRFDGQPRTDSGPFSDSIKHVEWVEQYEQGVYVTLGYSRDNTTEIRHVNLSRKIFSERAAKTWWSNNRDKVYLRFVGQPRTGPFSDTSDHVELVMLETPVSLGTRPTFSINTKPTNSLADTRANIQTVIEWGKYYEPDVYVTLRAYRPDGVGTRDVTRVRFSGREFDARQAVAWWLMNREKSMPKVRCSGWAIPY